MLIDLDHFKAVNDEHGPRRRRPAAALGGRPAARGPARGGHGGRLGGDEFALLLVGTGPRRRRRVGAALGARAAPGAALGGVAVFPGDGVDQDDLHRAADARPLRAQARPPPARRRGAPRAELGRRAGRRGGRADGRAARALPRRRASYAARDRPRARVADAIDRLRLAAMLHDVGKVRVPEAILRKPAPLTEAEWDEIAKHPVVGAEIVARVEGLAEIGPWIRHSHERIDGAGLSRRPRRRGHPRRLAHPPGRRRLRRDDQRPLLPPRDGARRGHGRARAPRRARSSTPPASRALRTHLARGPDAGAPAAG